jgi:hypothetical protein
MFPLLSQLAQAPGIAARTLGSLSELAIWHARSISDEKRVDGDESRQSQVTGP